MEASNFSSHPNPSDHEMIGKNSKIEDQKIECTIDSEDSKVKGDEKITKVITSHLLSGNRCDRSQIDVNFAARRIQQVARGLIARNKLIQKYVEKHFNYTSNVPSLSQTKVIYLGEIHTDLRSQLRNAWLIDHLYKKNDRILIEEEDRQEPWIKEKDRGIASQVGFVQKEVELWGWDDDLLKAFENNVFVLGDCLELVNEFLDQNASDIEKKVKFDQALKLMKDLTFKDQLSDYLDDADLIRKAYEECPQNFLKTLICLASLTLDSLDDKDFDDHFTKRQSSLTKKVHREFSTEKKDLFRKVFVIAGNLHLIQKNAIESHLSQTLDHRYAILTPKQTPLSEVEKQKIEVFSSQVDGMQSNSCREKQNVKEFTEQNLENADKFFIWMMKNHSISKQKILHPFGFMLEGEFEDGLFRKGVMTIPSGPRCEGEFENYMLKKGIVHQPNGTIVEGEFFGGRLMKGTMTYPDGTVIVL